MLVNVGGNITKIALMQYGQNFIIMKVLAVFFVKLPINMMRLFFVLEFLINFF